MIYSDDSGITWRRSEKIRGGIFGIKSSEGQLVQLSGGTLRLYSRNKAGYIGYSDSTDGGKTWSKYKLDPELKYCSDCMVSFMNYDGLIDGQKAIIASYPTTKKRKKGVVRVGLYGEDNKINWKYCYNVTDDDTDFTEGHFVMMPTCDYGFVKFNFRNLMILDAPSSSMSGMISPRRELPTMVGMKFVRVSM